MHKLKPKFLLKDQLFNQEKVERIAGQIQAVYPDFQSSAFIAEAVAGFVTRELMERIYWIKECLAKYLPEEYQVAAKILVESLPPANNPNLSDNDFGDFIYAPYGNFVATYGTAETDVAFSLSILKELTKRFSVEFPIRTFINLYPEQTLTALRSWAADENYHVRRLVSEGTRPKLPWAKKIHLSHQIPIELLDILYADKTRYVTRSVANHLNDIAKIDVSLVLQTLTRWRSEHKQTKSEMEFIIHHSLRSLVRVGDTQALQLLGYEKPQITIADFKIAGERVAVGESVVFSFSVTNQAQKEQSLLIDYVLYFQKANGTLAPKTFKVSKSTLQPGEIKLFSKLHPIRPMSTRTLHLGAHEIELQINGKSYGKVAFDLVE